MSTNLTVGIADMKLHKTEGSIITYALGSCIGICLYDPLLKLGSLTHIMLPLNVEAGRKNPLKYADTGLAEAVQQMKRQGAAPARMWAKLAGGAKMFAGSGGSLGSIGQRNIDSVHMCLRKEGIRLMSEDVGSSYARTLLFDVATGRATVRSYGHPDKIL